MHRHFVECGAELTLQLQCLPDSTQCPVTGDAALTELQELQEHCRWDVTMLLDPVSLQRFRFYPDERDHRVGDLLGSLLLS